MRTAEQRVIDDEEHNGAERRDDNAIDIEPGHAAHSEDVEEPAADNCPADPEQNVQDDALASPIDDFAANDSRERTASTGPTRANA